jgi:hypothetical protein
MYIITIGGDAMEKPKRSKRKNIYFEPSLEELIKKYQEEKNISSFAGAVKDLILKGLHSEQK